MPELLSKFYMVLASEVSSDVNIDKLLLRSIGAIAQPPGLRGRYIGLLGDINKVYSSSAGLHIENLFHVFPFFPLVTGEQNVCRRGKAKDQNRNLHGFCQIPMQLSTANSATAGVCHQDAFPLAGSLVGLHLYI